MAGKCVLTNNAHHDDTFLLPVVWCDYQLESVSELEAEIAASTQKAFISLRGKLSGSSGGAMSSSPGSLPAS